MAEWLANYSGLWLCSQVLMHLAITLRIVYWNGSGHRYRPGVSLLAYLIAASSACAALNIVLRWHLFAGQAAQPFMTLFVAAVALLVLKARGNVAFMLPG